MLVDALSEDMPGVREYAIGVAHLDREAGRDVGIGPGMCARRILLQGRAAVVDGRQRLVVHVDPIHRIFGNVTALGDDAGDRLAGVAHFVLGKRVRHPRDAQRRMRHKQRQRLAAHRLGQFGKRQYGVHAGKRRRRRLLDAAHAGMRMRAAHEGRVQHAGQMDVVDELALAAQQRRILLARSRGAEAVRVHRPASWMRFAAVSAASTIPW
jgi:hypothetical protein